MTALCEESRRVGAGYIHDGNEHKGAASLRWTPRIPAAGEYEIVLHFPPNPNRATNVPVTVEAGGKATLVTINQREQSGAVSLGKFTIAKGGAVSITLTNAGTDGYVVADGVQLLAK